MQGANRAVGVGETLFWRPTKVTIEAFSTSNTHHPCWTSSLMPNELRRKIFFVWFREKFWSRSRPNGNLAPTVVLAGFHRFAKALVCLSPSKVQVVRLPDYFRQTSVATRAINMIILRIKNVGFIKDVMGGW